MKSKQVDGSGIGQLRLVVAGAAAAYAILIGAYFLVFWRDGCCNREAWGQFGDFIGGTANPILGVVSILLLFATLQEQRQVLRETQRRATLEEVQRLVAGAAQRVDSVLRTPVDVDSDQYVFINNHSIGAGRDPHPSAATLEDLLQVAHKALLNQKIDFFEVIAIHTARGFGELGIAMRRLDAVLQVFEDEGGDKAVLRVYGLQLDAPALFLRAVDELAIHPPGLRDYGDAPLRRLGLEARFEALRAGIARVNTDLDNRLAKDEGDS